MSFYLFWNFCSTYNFWTKSAKNCHSKTDIAAAVAALARIVVSSDGLEGKGLSWLSLSLRPCQAPALLTFQPSRPGSLPRFSSTSQDLLQTIALH